MPSEDGVAGFFWTNWKESRPVYFREPNILFQIFVEFSQFKLQTKELTTSLTNQCNQWLIDVIDDHSMTKNFVAHRLLIDRRQ